MIQVSTCCPVKSLPRWEAGGGHMSVQKGEAGEPFTNNLATKCFQVENVEGKAQSRVNASQSLDFKTAFTVS